MTTITINRALLEQIVERFETCDCEICTRTSIDDIRAALAAPAAAPEQAFVCSLGCTDECVARAHGVPSECPSLPRQPATAPDEQLRKDAERYRWLRHESLRLSFSAELVSLLVANQSELDGAMEKEA